MRKQMKMGGKNSDNLRWGLKCPNTCAKPIVLYINSIQSNVLKDTEGIRMNMKT